MKHLKQVHVPRGYEGLHIEVDGCIVNIRVGLETADGHKVTSIAIKADRYDGDSWLIDTGEPKGPCERHGRAPCSQCRFLRLESINIRVIKDEL